MIDFWQQSAAELQLPPATVACVVRAADQYNLPPGLVLSVMKVEGGVDGAVHRNTNGSYDYGLMQINSIWLPKVLPMGFTREHLVHKPCDNLSVAAWIMRQNLDASDHFWRGVGNYHSRNGRENTDYQRKIAAAAKTLPESWQWWNPKGWNTKALVAKLPWLNKGSGTAPEALASTPESDASSPAESSFAAAQNHHLSDSALIKTRWSPTDQVASSEALDFQGATWGTYDQPATTVPNVARSVAPSVWYP